MKDVSGYATREISPTMEAFADYLIAEVYGGTLPAEIDEVAFRKGVALGGSTRGYFQASERWKSDPRNYLANVDSRREAKAEEAKAKAEEAIRKANERAAKATAALEEIRAKAEAKAAEIAARIAAENEADEADSALEDANDLEAVTGRVSADESADEGSEEPTGDEVPNPATVGRRSRRAA